MTAAFSQGRQKRYAYYTCVQRTCPTRRRSYRAAMVDDEFGGRLTELSIPARDVKLIAEWLDVGGQYFNNPFDAPLN